VVKTLAVTKVSLSVAKGIHQEGKMSLASLQPLGVTFDPGVREVIGATM
jgi:hypothetical protein